MGKNKGKKGGRSKGLSQMKAGQTNQVKQLATETDRTSAPKKEKSGPLSIADTKLGVTLVLSKEDCNTLGFNDSTITREVVREVRSKLGLQPRKRDAEAV